MELVFATNNAHKLEEVRQMLPPDITVRSLADIGCTADIPETASTLEGNAELKARYVAERYGLDVFADDTGLEVEALNGAPGVLSARYAGEGHDSAANMAKLLCALDGQANRRARFRTSICLIRSGKAQFAEGIVNGSIAAEASGAAGFGYDPIFCPDEAAGRTFAQLSSAEKNAISHRGRAITNLLKILTNA